MQAFQCGASLFFLSSTTSFIPRLYSMYFSLLSLGPPFPLFAAALDTHTLSVVLFSPAFFSLHYFFSHLILPSPAPRSSFALFFLFALRIIHLFFLFICVDVDILHKVVFQHTENKSENRISSPHPILSETLHALFKWGS